MKKPLRALRREAVFSVVPLSGVDVDHDVFHFGKTSFNHIVNPFRNRMTVLQTHPSVGTDLNIHIDPVSKNPGMNQINAQDVFLLQCQLTNLLLYRFIAGIHHL